MELKEKVYLETLGCSKNLVDSEVMLGCLKKSGYQFTGSREEAQIIIINTCAFIRDATKESIETILLIAEQKKTGSCRYLIVCGCLPQRYQHELLKELPEVDLFLGTGEFQKISKHVKILTSGSKISRLQACSPTFLMGSSTPRTLSSPGSSAYLKIAEGCSHHCTYCAIPRIKGPYAGRSPKSILAESRKLVDNGILEINLIAQDTTQYGRLAELLKKMALIPGLRWIRLLYCHPANLNTDILKIIAGEENICNYIDLPLQHITDSMLKKMGRGITEKKIICLLEEMKKVVPGLSIRTTFIVGFPGETDKNFDALLQFAADMKFDHLGAFEYRDEEGTPASKLGRKVPEKTKKHRYNELMRLQAKISKDKNKALIGNNFEVLVEGISLEDNKYRLRARTQYQAPEVDGVVFINEDLPAGSFADIRVIKALTYDLVGEVI